MTGGWYAAAGHLIPDTITVVGRSALQLRIRQDNGRVADFWDPSGIAHHYTYVTPAVGSLANHKILTSHQTGGLTNATSQVALGDLLLRRAAA